MIRLVACVHARHLMLAAVSVYQKYMPFGNQVHTFRTMVANEPVVNALGTMVGEHKNHGCCVACGCVGGDEVACARWRVLSCMTVLSG